MIQEIVNLWEENKSKIREELSKEPPSDYTGLVKLVIKYVGESLDMDAERIHCINDGNYQGTLLFIIPEVLDQPHDYWYVKVDYGSCCGCDTLERIKSNNYSEDKIPDEQQLNDYMMLALHIVQGIKAIED